MENYWKRRNHVSLSRNAPNLKNKEVGIHYVE